MRRAVSSTLQIGALIISPTRELATQISQVVEEFLKDMTQFTKGLFIGGSHIDEDINLITRQGSVLAKTCISQNLFLSIYVTIRTCFFGFHRGNYSI